MQLVINETSMVHIQANMFFAGNILEKSTLANRDKLGNITLQTGLKVGFFVGFFHPPEENLIANTKKSYTPMNRFVNEYKMCYKRNGLKSWLFGWFLAPLCDNHECMYICISLSLV